MTDITPADIPASAAPMDAAIEGSVPDSLAPPVVEAPAVVADQDNPYIERLGQMVSLLGEVQGPNVDIPGRFLLKLVTGTNRAPKEEFQLFYEATKHEPRIRSVGDFTFRFDPQQVSSDLTERYEQWDGSIDGLDVRSLVDQVVHQSQRSTARSINFRALLAQVPGICGEFLNEVQFVIFRMLLDSHSDVLEASQSNFVLAPKAGPDRKSTDLYDGGPLESETVKEVSDLEAMLRILRREGGGIVRKPSSRRRLHYKRGANMDGGQQQDTR